MFVEVADAGEEQPLPTAATSPCGGCTATASPPVARTLVSAIRATELPPGPVYAWVAGEASGVRAVRRHLVGERGVDKKQIAFAGYWRLHLTQDADPAPEDAANAAEATAELTRP